MTLSAPSDIAIAWDPATATADWVLEGGDVQPGDPLLAAVLVSLFTDRVAPPDWVPGPGEDADPRGWWADTYSDRPIGSHLWLLANSYRTDAQTLLLRARGYAAEALQWLIDDGFATAVSVTTAWLTTEAMAIAVSITAPGGAVSSYQFRY
jgi:phage gp46-like protein